MPVILPVQCQAAMTVADLGVVIVRLMNAGRMAVITRRRADLIIAQHIIRATDLLHRARLPPRRSSTSSSRSSSSSSKKYDQYDVYSYTSAQDFADDKYEEFYDYEDDYEDEDEAYDAAEDYWRAHH